MEVKKTYISHWTPASLRKFRITYNLSQQNLALLLEAPQQRVSEWEKGTHKMKRPYSKILDMVEEKLRPIKITAAGNMKRYQQLVLQAYGVEIDLREKKYA